MRVGDAIDGPAAVDVHHHANRDEDRERRPNPGGSPPRTQETEDNAGRHREPEEEPAQGARGFGDFEQLADPDVTALLFQVERDRDRMDQEQSQHARDMDENDPAIHAVLPSMRRLSTYTATFGKPASASRTLSAGYS